MTDDGSRGVAGRHGDDGGDGRDSDVDAGGGARPPDPETAFALLGHDLRLAILQAFFEEETEPTPEALDAARADRRRSFSELMRAVGVRDSGRFNYHLDRLEGVYVERDGDAYVPTAGAVAVHRAVVANRPTADPPTDLDLSAPCPSCGATMRGRYDQEYLTVDCPDCTAVWGFTYPFPTNGVRERDGAAVIAAVHDRLLHHVALARRGQCPDCAGVTTVTLPRDRLDGEATPVTRLRCDTCGWRATVDVLTALRLAPRVAAALVAGGALPEPGGPGPTPAPDGAALGEAGGDAERAGGDPSSGDGSEAVHSLTGTVRAEDPTRVGLRATLPDGSTLAVVVTDALEVVSVTREPAG